MMPEMKLVISQSNKTVHSMTKEVNSQHLRMSLEQFQSAVNAALTKMIEEFGESGDSNMVEPEDSESEEENLSSNSRKRKR